MDRIITRAIEMTAPDVAEISFTIEGKQIKFMRTETEAFRQKIREQNRLNFIATHLKVWHEFVNFKYDCAMSVFEIEGHVELITSDNPVSIHSSIQNPFNLFDPTNIIQVPLDKKHYLLVYPNTEAPRRNIISRSRRDKYFALTTNLFTQRNSENWTIGYPGTVEQHFADQEKYGADTPENNKAFEMIKQKSLLMQEFVIFAEKNGFFSPATAKWVNDHRDLECLKDDYEFNEIAKQIKNLTSN